MCMCARSCVRACVRACVYLCVSGSNCKRRRALLLLRRALLEEAAEAAQLPAAQSESRARFRSSQRAARARQLERAAFSPARRRHAAGSIPHVGRPTLCVEPVRVEEQQFLC
eukprot:5072010-Pleurochrysis_carterae.AAC.2